MKKLLVIIMCMLLLVSCGNSNKNSKSDSKKSKEISVVLPKDFFGEDFDLESVKTSAAESGVIDVTENEDGTITYLLTEVDYEKLLSDLKSTIDETFDKFISSDEVTSSIKKIEHNDDFSEISFIVDKEAFQNSFDALISLAALGAVSPYRMMESKDGTIPTISYSFIDEKTKEVFDSGSFPEDLKLD